jgi:DNA-binding SARP family transcriptional activator/TolB-like protein
MVPHDAQDMTTLRLFGGASLERDGAGMTGPVAQRHRLALLSLLYVSHPRPLSRDKVIGLLWPERDAEHARNLLNQALHAVRKALGHDAIVSSGDLLRLGARPLTCDVLAFRAAVAAGDRARAIRLHAGPLLDGFFLSEAPAFEEWVDRERERLRRTWRQAAGELVDEDLARGEPAQALACVQRLVADDPYDARATRRLMEALEAAGDRAGALRQARLHTDLLAQDLGMGPDPEVRAFAAQLQDGGARNPAGLPPAGRRGQVPADTDPPTGAALAPPPVGTRWWRRRKGRYAAALLGVALLGLGAGRAFMERPGRITRLAVLPLANLTGDSAENYFVAGMHDALVTELAQVRSLTVQSRQSVLRYADSDLPVPVIAGQLGVDALVEGAVFMSKDSVRITVQVVRANPEGHVISRMFTGRRDHALALQRRVAGAIADALRARVRPDVRARLARDRSVNEGAQQAYLDGLYHLEHAAYGRAIPRAERAVELRQAIARLEESVRLDSTWARAYAKLALADHFLASSFAGEAEEYYPKAKAAALRALELDDSEAQAYASLGFVLYRYERDWEGAERAIQRSIELDPNSHHWIYALYLRNSGRHDEAIAEYLRAVERDPLSDLLKAQLAGEYACAGHTQEAIAQARELHARHAAAGSSGVRVVGDTTWLLTFLVDTYSTSGEPAKAVDAAERLVALSDTATAGPDLAFALASAGRVTEARSLVTELEANASGPFHLQPAIYAALGDTDRALAALRAVLDDLDPHEAAVIGCWPVVRLLRDDPRMQALMTRVGLPTRAARGPG